ncbi:MAG: hypothetical protein ACFB15_31255 [Cyclobacteriaceae bacterium]
MKMFNAKDTKKTSKKRAWLTMLLIGILAAGTISCSEEDDDNGAPVDPGTEVESAWMTSYRVGTPNGDVFYLNVSEEIPESFDLSRGIELGLGKSVSSFSEHPYVYDANAKTITKWAVNRSDLSLSVEGILSLAASGFDPDGVVYPAYVSETEAYIADLEEGLIIEWNQQDMTITEVHQVEPITSIQPNPTLFGSEWIYVSNEKIFYPIRDWGPSVCCEFNTNGLGAIVGVFDTRTNTLTYERDSRILASWNFMPEDENGDFLVSSIEPSAFVPKYFDVDSSTLPSFTTLLKFNADGTFDPNFAFDLKEVLDIYAMGSPIAFGNNKAIFTYYDIVDGGLPESFDDRFQHRQGGVRIVSVDFDTRVASDFTGLAKYNVYVQPTAKIDGTFYHLAGSNDEDGNFISYYLRQDAFDQFTELGAYGVDGSGDASYVLVSQLGKLWGD